MNTPILQTLLPLIQSYGTHKAVQFLEGEEELALPDDDLCSFLSRRDVEWDQLETTAQDQIRDAYLEAIKASMAQRLGNGVSSPSIPVREPSEGSPEGLRLPVARVDSTWADVVPDVRKEIESCHDALRDLYTTNSYSLPEAISFKLRHFQKWAFKFLMSADRPPIHTEDSPSDGEMLDWLNCNPTVLHWSSHGHWRVIFGNKDSTNMFKSLRSAIKAAMEQEKPTTND
jgi:hypothetical protein